MAVPNVGVKGIHTVPETNRAWCFYDAKAENATPDLLRWIGLR